MAKKLSRADLDRFQATLEQLLKVVSGDIQNLHREALGDGAEQSKVSAEDSGGEINAMELSLELLERDERTVQEIVDALERVRAGHYGTCESCGKQIRKTRLQAMPYARKCIDCQRRTEVDGR